LSRKNKEYGICVSPLVGD